MVGTSLKIESKLCLPAIGYSDSKLVGFRTKARVEDMRTPAAQLSEQTERHVEIFYFLHLLRASEYVRLSREAEGRPFFVQYRSQQFMREDIAFVCDWPQFLYAQNPTYSEYLGFIKYRIEMDDVARTVNYYPKGEPRRDGSRAQSFQGAGMFVELVCTQDLAQRETIQFIQTSAIPSRPRQAQLRKLNLPIDQPVLIEDWSMRLYYYLQDRETRPAYQVRAERHPLY